MSDFFGGGENTRVMSHLNKSGSLRVHVLVAPDRPGAGLTSFSTIDMAQFDNLLVDSSKGRPIRIELPATCDDEFPGMADVLGACTFYVGSGECSITPDVIFADVVGIQDPGLTTQHARC